jgi:hypothetical protein
MEKKNMARFAVTSRLIEDALGIPEGHEIVGAEWDFASRTIQLYVEGPDLPEVERGQIVPRIKPSISYVDTEDGRRVHSWHWCAEQIKETHDGRSSRKFRTK